MRFLGPGALPVVFLLLILPHVAWGQSALDNLYLGFTNKLDYRRFQQDFLREEALRNRMELTAQRGIFGAWIRLESLQISDATSYDPFGAGDDEFVGEQRFDQTEVTRRAVSLDTESVQATVGDFSYSFGRGLMLSVFEDEELNFDTRLEGVVASVSDHRGSVTAVAGSHDENRFRAAFVEPDWFGPVRFGGGFVEAWGAGANTDILDREQHWGGLMEFVAGPATLYAEYTERSFPGRNSEGGDEEDGHGAYAAALVSLGQVTLSGEVRDYFKFEHEFHDPPTTLRQHTWTLLNRTNGIVNSDITDVDANGFLVEAEYVHDYFTTVQASFSRLDQDEADVINNEFWEAYGEAKGSWREEVFVTLAGAESELTLGNTFEERITALGECVWEFDDRNSVSFGLEWSQVQESNDATSSFEFPEEYRDRIFFASWARSPWLNLTVSFEDTTEDDPSEPNDSWVSVLAEVAVGENHNMQFALGAERGGWKCTGGVCFFEPEFEGLKVNWIARY